MELDDPRITRIIELLNEVRRASLVWHTWTNYIGGWNKSWHEITQDQADEAIAWFERVKANPLLQLAEEE